MKRKRRCLVTTIFLLTLLKTIYMEYTDEIYGDNDRKIVGEDSNHNIISSNIFKSIVLNHRHNKKHFITANKIRHNNKRHKIPKTKSLSKRHHIPMIRITEKFPKITEYHPKNKYHFPVNKRSHLTQREMTFQAVVPSQSGASKDLISITKDKISEGNKEKAKQLALDDENPGNYYGSKANPAKSCRDIFLTNRDQPSGNYWIKTADEELLLVTCGFPTHKQKSDDSQSEMQEKKHEAKMDESKPESHHESHREVTQDSLEEFEEKSKNEMKKKQLEKDEEKDKRVKDSEEITTSKETSHFIRAQDKSNDGEHSKDGGGGHMGNFQEVPPMVKEYLLSNHIHVPGLNLDEAPTENIRKKDKSTVSDSSLRNPAPFTRSPGPSNSMQKDNPNNVKTVPTKPPRYSWPKTKTYATLVPPLQPTPPGRTKSTKRPKRPTAKARRPTTTEKITTPLHTTKVGFRSTVKKKKTPTPKKRTPKKKLPDDLEEFEEERKKPKTTRRMIVKSTKEQKPTRKPTKAKKTTLPPGIEAPPTLTPQSSSTKEPEIIAPPPLSKIKGEEASHLQAEPYGITQQFVKTDSKQTERPSFNGKPLLPNNINVHLPQLNTSAASENVTQREYNRPGIQPASKLHFDPNKPFVMINGVSSDPRENPYDVEKQQENIDLFAHSNEHIHPNEHIQADGSLAFPSNNVNANQKANVENAMHNSSYSDPERLPPVHKARMIKNGGDGAGDLGDIQQEFPPDMPKKETVTTSLDEVYGRRGNHVPTDSEIHHPDKDIRNDYKAAEEFETQPQIRSWGFREKNMLERERYDKQYHDFEKLDKTNITVKPYIEEAAFKKSWAENRQEMARQKFKEQYDEFEKISQELKEKEEGIPSHSMKPSENYAAQYKAFEDYKNATGNSTKNDSNEKESDKSNSTKNNEEKAPQSKQSFGEYHHDDDTHDNVTTHYTNPEPDERISEKKKHEEDNTKEDKSDSYVNYIKAIQDNSGGETSGKNDTKDEPREETKKINKKTDDTEQVKEEARKQEDEKNKSEKDLKKTDKNESKSKESDERKYGEEKKDENLKEMKSKDTSEKSNSDEKVKEEKIKADKDIEKEQESSKTKIKSDEKVDEKKENLKTNSEKSDNKAIPERNNETETSDNTNIKSNTTDDMIKIGKGDHPAMYTNAPLGTSTTNATSVETIDGEKTKVEDANATIMLTTKKDNTLSLGSLGTKTFKQIDVKQFLKNEKLEPSENVHEDVVMDDEGSEVLDMFFKNKGNKKSEAKESKKLKQISGPPNPLVEKLEENQNENLGNSSQKLLEAANNEKEVNTDKKDGDEIKVLEKQKDDLANGTEKFELYKKLHGGGNLDFTTSKPSNIYVDNRVFIYGNVKGGSAPQLSHAIRNHNKEGEQTVERKLKIESNTDDLSNDDAGLTKSNISNDKKDVKTSIKNDNPDFAVSDETPDISGMQPFQEVKEYDKKFNLNNLFKGSNISIENHVHTTGSLKALVRTAPMETKKPSKNDDIDKMKPKTIEFVIPEPKKLSFTNTNGNPKMENPLDIKTMEQEARINFIRKQALDQDDVSMGKFSTSGLKEFQYNKGQTHGTDDTENKKNAAKRTKQKGIFHRRPTTFDPDKRTKMIDYLLKKKDTRTAFHLNQDIRDFGAIKKSNGLDQWLEAATTANGGKKSEIVGFKKSYAAIPVQEEDDDIIEINNTKPMKNITQTINSNTTKAINKTTENPPKTDKKATKKIEIESPINQESLPGAGDVGDVFEGVEDETPPDKKQFNMGSINNANHLLASNMQRLLNDAQKSMGNVPGYTEDARKDEQRAKEERNKKINSNPGNQTPPNNQETNNAQNNKLTHAQTTAQDNGMIHTVNDSSSQLNGENLPGMDEQFSIRKRRSISDTEIVSKDQIQLGNVASVEMNNKTFYLIYNLHPTNKSSDLKIPERMLSNLTSQFHNSRRPTNSTNQIRPLNSNHYAGTPIYAASRVDTPIVIPNNKKTNTKKHALRKHKHKKRTKHVHHRKNHTALLNQTTLSNQQITHNNQVQSDKAGINSQFVNSTVLNATNYYISNDANRYSKNYSMISADVSETEKNNVVRNTSNLENNNSTSSHSNITLNSINQALSNNNGTVGEMISRRLTSSALYFHSFQPKITQVLDNRHDEVQFVTYDEPKDQFLSQNKDKNLLQRKSDSDFDNFYIANNYMRPSRRTDVVLQKSILPKGKSLANDEHFATGSLKGTHNRQAISSKLTLDKLKINKPKNLTRTRSWLPYYRKISRKNLTSRSSWLSSYKKIPFTDKLVAKKNSLKLHSTEPDNGGVSNKNRTVNANPMNLFDIRKITSPAIRLYKNITANHDLKQLLFNGVFPEARETIRRNTTKNTTKRTNKIIGSRARFFRNMELKDYLSHKNENNERLKKSKIVPSYNKLLDELSQLRRKRYDNNETDIIDDDETGVARMLIPSKVGHIQPSNIVPLPPVGHDPDDPPQSPIATEQTEAGKEKNDEETSHSKNKTSEDDVSKEKGKEKNKSEQEYDEKDGNKKEKNKKNNDEKDDEIKENKKKVDSEKKTDEKDTDSNKISESPQKEEQSKSAESVDTTLPPITEPHIPHPKTPHTTEPPPPKPDEKKSDKQKAKAQKPNGDSAPQEDKIPEAEANTPTENMSNGTTTDVGDAGKDEIGTGSKPLRLQTENGKKIDTTFEAGLQEEEKSKELQKQQQTNENNQTNNKQTAQNTNMDLGEQQPNDSAFDIGNLTTFNYPVNVTVLEQGILQLINQTAPKLKTGKEKLKEEMEKALREKNKQYPALKLPVKNGEYIPPDNEEEDDAEPEPIAIPDNKKPKKEPQRVQNTPLPPPKIPSPMNMGVENDFAEIIDSTPTESGFHTTVHATPKPITKTRKEEAKTQPQQAIPEQAPKEGPKPNELENPGSMSAELNFPSLQTDGSNQIPIIPIAKDSPLGKLLYPALGDGQTPTLGINEAGSPTVHNSTVAGFNGPGYSDMLLKQTKKLLNEGKLNRRDLLRLLQTSKKQYITKQEVVPPHEPSEQMFILFPDKNEDNKDLTDTTPKINLPGITSDIVDLPSLSGYYKNLNDQGEVRSKVTNSPIDSKTLITLPNLNNGGFTVQKYNNGLVLVPNAVAGARREKILPQNINLDVHYKITSTQKKNIINNRGKPSLRSSSHFNRIINDT